MDLKSPQYIETLDIINFLSIKNFNWVIKPFNIITGDMASGKSLCMKLLYFFEEILLSTLLLPPIFSKRLFDNGNFFERLSKKFRDFFYLNDNTCQGICITYNFKANGSNFIISVTGDNNSEKKLSWKCDYLKERLIKWSGYFKSPETVDMARDVRIRIHEEIRHDFLDKLPISTMFVPASRAALAVIGGNIAFRDNYLDEFAHNRDFLLSYYDISLSKELADILHVINIKKNPSDEHDVLLELRDNSTVPSLFSSSGQQELVYLLLLMEKLPEISFTYGRMLSFFIEEPSAHLFPEEQKKLIERIVTLFQQKKELETRFFITTHSPYILNVINNMLKKDLLIKKHPHCAKEIEANVKSPCLSVEDLSAFFIEEEGKDMIDPDKKIIFADQIDKISDTIMNDRSYLDDLEDGLS
jgi:predicted ATPase